MARLRTPEHREVWTSRLLLEPDYDPRASKRNGAYRGRLPVKRVSQGVSGCDLAGGRPALAPGQVWRRGVQLVEILQVIAPPRARNPARQTPPWIVFRELSHGSAQRRMREPHFLRTARLEASK